MNEHLFNVFGSRVAIVRQDGKWRAFALGPDGKRRPAGFVVPEFIAEAELCEFLFDLFHENAAGSHGGVERLDS